MTSESSPSSSSLLFVESNTLSEEEKKNKIPAFDHDFILLAEFCEQRGPVPIMVWPPDKGSQRFDLNKFVVRILSSDHTRRLDPKGMNVGWQNPDDTQVYLTDNSQGAHCYVHHLTLHDLYARGYVRPICLCYITVEPDKILSFFPELLAVFTKVSQTLKFGNNRLFVTDIESQLSALYKTIQTNTSIEERANLLSEEFPELTTEIFDEVLSDLQHLRSQFQLYMDEGSCHMLEKHLLDDTSHSGCSGNSNSSNGSVSGLQQDWNSGLEQDTVTDLRQQQQRQIDFLSLYEQGLSVSSCNLHMYMPMVLKCIHKSTNFEESLRNIPTICHRVFDTVSDILADILEHFSRPTFVLELEKDDLHIMATRDAPSLLFVGRNLVMDFNMEREPYSQQANRSNNMRSSPQCLPKSYPYASSVSSYSSIGSSIGSLYKDALEEYEGTEDPSSIITALDGLTVQDVLPHRARNYKLNLMYKNGFNGCFISNVYEEDINTFAVSMSPRTKLPGRGILLSREYYSFIKEMVYSLLTGRLLIIYGRPEHEQYVRNLVITFSMFVPGQAWLESFDGETSANERRRSKAAQRQSLTRDFLNDGNICSWRTKPLTIQDLSTLKLCGLSKRATIPKVLEPYISKLDLEESVLFAPPYRGEYLDRIFSRRKTWPDEETFQSYIHSVLLQLSTKASLYYYLHSISSASKSASSITAPSANSYDDHRLNNNSLSASPRPKSLVDHHYFMLKKERHRSVSNPPLTIKVATGSLPPSPQPNSNNNMSGETNSSLLPTQNVESIHTSPKRILAKLGIRRSDIDIVEHLSELIKTQQARSILPQLPESIVLHSFT